MAAETVKRRHRIRKSPWSSLELVMFLIAAVMTLLLLLSGIVDLVGLIRHRGGKQEDTATITTTTEAQETAQGQNTQETEPTEPVTENPLTKFAEDTGYAGQLYQQLDEHPEAAYVLRNLDLYPEEVLVFVTRFPEAMRFAAGYPDYMSTGVRQEIDLTGEVEQGAMPSLIQWDPRWAYYPYGEGMVGYSGCGPTCLSMVSIYLTGYHDNDPLTVATFAADNGYYAKGSGSAWTLMSNASVNFGVVGKELPLDENKVISSVEEGKPVILAMGPGIFTDNGHFIVIYGHDENGFLIRDPNSPENTAKHWLWEDIKSQIRNLWVFEAA